MREKVITIINNGNGGKQKKKKGLLTKFLPFPFNWIVGTVGTTLPCGCIFVFIFGVGAIIVLPVVAGSLIWNVVAGFFGDSDWKHAIATIEGYQIPVDRDNLLLYAPLWVDGVKAGDYDLAHWLDYGDLRNVYKVPKGKHTFTFDIGRDAQIQELPVIMACKNCGLAVYLDADNQINAATAKVFTPDELAAIYKPTNPNLKTQPCASGSALCRFAINWSQGSALEGARYLTLYVSNDEEEAYIGQILAFPPGNRTNALWSAQPMFDSRYRAIYGDTIKNGLNAANAKNQIAAGKLGTALDLVGNPLATSLFNASGTNVSSNIYNVRTEKYNYFTSAVDTAPNQDNYKGTYLPIYPVVATDPPSAGDGTFTDTLKTYKPVYLGWKLSPADVGRISEIGINQLPSFANTSPYYYGGQYQNEPGQQSQGSGSSTGPGPQQGTPGLPPVPSPTQGGGNPIDLGSGNSSTGAGVGGWSTLQPLMGAGYPTVVVRPTDGDVFVIGNNASTILLSHSLSNFAVTQVPGAGGPDTDPIRPRGAFDATTGTLHLVWMQRVSGKYHNFYITYTASGQFGPLRDLTQEMGLANAGFGDLAISPLADGTFYLAQEFENLQVGISVSKDKGATWSRPVRLGTTNTPGVSGTRVAVDSKEGIVHLIWNTNTDLMARELLPSALGNSNSGSSDMAAAALVASNWTTPSRLDNLGTPGKRLFWPGLTVSNATADAYAVWQEDGPAGGEGPGEASFVHYDHITHQWQGEVKNVSHTTTTSTLTALAPAVVVGTPANNVWVTWEYLNKGSENAGAGYVHSVDGGASFLPTVGAGTLACTTFTRAGPWSDATASSVDGKIYWAGQLAGKSGLYQAWLASTKSDGSDILGNSSSSSSSSSGCNDGGSTDDSIGDAPVATKWDVYLFDSTNPQDKSMLDSIFNNPNISGLPETTALKPWLVTDFAGQLALRQSTGTLAPNPATDKKYDTVVLAFSKSSYNPPPPPPPPSPTLTTPGGNGTTPTPGATPTPTPTVAPTTASSSGQSGAALGVSANGSDYAGGATPAVINVSFNLSNNNSSSNVEAAAALAATATPVSRSTSPNSNYSSSSSDTKNNSGTRITAQTYATTNAAISIRSFKAANATTATYTGPNFLPGLPPEWLALGTVFVYERKRPVPAQWPASASQYGSTGNGVISGGSGSNYSPGGGAYDVRFGRMTADQIEQVLAQHPWLGIGPGGYQGSDPPTPNKMTGMGVFFVQMQEKYNINAAYALAFGLKETQLGTTGYHVYNDTTGFGRDVYGITGTGWLPGKCIAGFNGRFCGYATWQDAVEDFFALLSEGYTDAQIGVTKQNGQGRGQSACPCTTIERILPWYAPYSENDTDLYIKQVEDWVTEWGVAAPVYAPPVAGGAVAMPAISQLDRSQYDSDQQYYAWKESTCGPTSATMVLDALGYQFRVGDVLDAAISDDAINANEGTVFWEYLTSPYMSAKGANLKLAYYESSSAIAYLDFFRLETQKGIPVIVNVKDSYYYGGHFFVVAAYNGSDDTFTVFDPYSRQRPGNPPGVVQHWKADDLGPILRVGYRSIIVTKA